MSWFYLSNLPDGGPDNVPFPVANETDPEIKVETVTGKDPRAGSSAPLAPDLIELGLGPHQMFRILT